MSRYNIPEEYEKYSASIDDLIDDYTRMVNEDLVQFDGADLMPLAAIIGRTFNKLQDELENIKEIDDKDRVSLYFIMMGIVLDKSLMASDKLTDSQKATVKSIFSSDGLYQTFVDMFNGWYKKQLKKMDTNSDKRITRNEFLTHVYKNNMKHCACAGKETNMNSAKCFTACCFPVLSGGDGIIDLSEDNNDELPLAGGQSEAKTEGK